MKSEFKQKPIFILNVPSEATQWWNNSSLG